MKNIYNAVLKAHSEIKYEDHPRTFCMTRSCFSQWIDKCPAENGITVYLVERPEDVPTSVSDWVKITNHATCMVSKDGEWKERREND